MIWLGAKRGYLSDYITQKWVEVTGASVDPTAGQWLAGPVGKPTGIGLDFFQQLAVDQKLVLRPGQGLIRDFACIFGPKCSPSTVDRAVRDFYEQTTNYELDAWSEWLGWFKPLGRVLAVLFSRRLQQLNIPISPLDTSLGITSEVVDLVKPETGEIEYTAWIRQLLRNKNVLYAGSYSTCSIPGFAGTCVKVVFPLPNGNGIVIMYPESHDDGSFSLTSAGDRFGDPGFYFTVVRDGRMWARYVHPLRESIRVYAAGEREVRADHVLRFFGVTFLRLHYRLLRRPTRIQDRISSV